MHKMKKHLFFDWGDTLMVDYPQYSGAMCTWPLITLAEGVAALMPRLSEKYNCVVLSNAAESDAELMRKAFERVGTDRFFSRFLTSKELKAKKPDEMFFINALRKINAAAGESVMIGNDYVKDIIPSKAVGLTTVFITDSKKAFPCADYTVNSFSGLDFLL